jgi:uncharacterized membrane protein YidH (DUF202 family)
MKLLAIVLIVFGIIGLLYGGLSWTRSETVLDAGPIEVTADKRERLPIPPIAGALCLIGGVVLLLRRP